MNYKIIHTLAFDRQFALFKHLREKIIARENQLLETPYLGQPCGEGIHSISMDALTLFYSISQDTITMLDIKKKDTLIPQEFQVRSSQS